MKEAVAVVAQKVAKMSAAGPCPSCSRMSASRSFQAEAMASRRAAEILLAASRRKGRARLEDRDERRDRGKGKLKARVQERLRLERDHNARRQCARLRMLSDWRSTRTAASMIVVMIRARSVPTREPVRIS